MKCLETRNKDGFRWRRYRLDDGRTTTTYEVPASVLRELGMKRATEAMLKFRRGEELRVRGQVIDDLIREGWKPTAIANEVGVTESAVRQRRARIKNQRSNKTV